MLTPTSRELLAQLHSGQLDFTEVAEQHLQHIERHNPTVNAVVTLNRAGALQQAQALQQLREQGRLPPLAGLPLTIKDAFATAGLRTTSSHPPLADYVPVRDATLVARLREAGGLLLGKTNLPQLASTPHCDSPLFGHTNNPWDPSRTSGGSSGGSAVAVAMGFSCLDLGSDIGGSIRIPAAFCGVAGFKATENRLPRTGHIPHLPDGERSVRHCLSFGLLARDVDSLQLGFKHLDGPDGEDTEVPPLLEAPTALRERPLRIAWWDDFAGLPLCRRTTDALVRTVEMLKARGVEVERRKPEGFDVDRAWYAYGVIMGSEIGLGMPGIERRGLTLAGRLLPPSQRLAGYFIKGLRFSLRRYNEALNLRERLIIELETFLDHWDAWLCPVAPTVAHPHVPGKGLNPLLAIRFDEHRLPWLEAMVSMTTPFSLTGSPVVVLPAGIEQGLPVGLQFIGKRWQDERLLSICREIEAITGGYVPPPGVISQDESRSGENFAVRGTVK
ncbi:amidase [Billgrantia kenyensis]|uniref:Amidase n=1 Tax=Billgrantia kenyensis TaxID=321266 RepID=A0A7W0AFG5_9GAMM|nr:amidase [Halomonas kenyensis]MBA2781163.1 amidase [Halomonas kenyensis]MCG6663863.1 amidase [Halomonas kenyensis]